MKSKIFVASVILALFVILGAASAADNSTMEEVPLADSGEDVISEDAPKPQSIHPSREKMQQSERAIIIALN